MTGAHWGNYSQYTIFNLITAHTLQAHSQAISNYRLCTFICFFIKAYVVGQQVEAIQMSTNNICFYTEPQKKYHISIIK